ncbi:MAG: DUF4340 domain-containing protein [Spirochaetota bacterium]
MKFKARLISLSSTLAVFVIIYLIGLFFSSSSVQRRNENRLLFPGFKTSEVVSIEIHNGNNRTIFQKDNTDDWILLINGNTFPAEKKKIDSFIKVLSELRQYRIVTENPADWERLGLTEKEGKKVIVKSIDGKAGLKIHIGNLSSRGKGDYLRLEGDNKVYITDVSISFYAEQKVKYWSHLRILPDGITGDDIISIETDADILVDKAANEIITAHYLLVRQGESKKNLWEYRGQKAVELDQNAVNQLANSLASIEAGEFVIDQTVTGDPDVRITVSTGTGKKFSISMVASKNDDAIYLQADSTPYTYLVNGWTVKRVVKTVDELSGK